MTAGTGTGNLSTQVPRLGRWRAGPYTNHFSFESFTFLLREAEELEVGLCQFRHPVRWESRWESGARLRTGISDGVSKAGSLLLRRSARTWRL